MKVVFRYSPRLTNLAKVSAVVGLAGLCAACAGRDP
jgi:hypothetical protein